MLGNQYFLMRKYQAASKEFEEALRQECNNYPAKVKLIICYTQTNRPYEALSLFYELISHDIEMIINIDQVADDCPCPGLIGQLEAGAVRYEDKFTINCMLGILWLYCDISVSLRYLKQAYSIDKENAILNKVIAVYEEYLRNHPQ
jgi:tetratricopeptide (TPR) repeat protein